MTPEIGIGLAFATGLLGALHCLGMCSGIAGGYFVYAGRGAGAVRLPPVLVYHGGRILVYALLGVAGAAVGRVLVQTGLIGKGQGLLMMAAGLLILAIGVVLLARPGGSRVRAAESTSGVEVPLMSPAERYWRPALAGALNGFVPCSLVFSVAVKAAATADPLRAGLLMVAFGLGTLPSMALVSLAGLAIGASARDLFGRLAGLLVIALGAWTFYEGLVFFDIMRGLANW